ARAAAPAPLLPGLRSRSPHVCFQTLLQSSPPRVPCPTAVRTPQRRSPMRPSPLHAGRPKGAPPPPRGRAAPAPARAPPAPISASLPPPRSLRHTIALPPFYLFLDSSVIGTNRKSAPLHYLSEPTHFHFRSQHKSENLRFP